MAWSKRKLNEYEYLSVWQRDFLSGGFAGFTYTNIAFVFDLLKVRAQHNKTENMSYQKEIARIYRTEGMRGFLKGYQGMFIRDTPGFAVYFGVYECFKRCMLVSEVDKKQYNYHGISDF